MWGAGELGLGRWRERRAGLALQEGEGPDGPAQGFEFWGDLCASRERVRPDVGLAGEMCAGEVLGGRQKLPEPQS